MGYRTVRSPRATGPRLPKEKIWALLPSKETRFEEQVLLLPSYVPLDKLTTLS